MVMHYISNKKVQLRDAALPCYFSFWRVFTKMAYISISFYISHYAFLPPSPTLRHNAADVTFALASFTVLSTVVDSQLVNETTRTAASTAAGPWRPQNFSGPHAELICLSLLFRLRAPVFSQ